MSRYDHLARRATGVACILGPLLLTFGAIAFVLGVNVTPDKVGSVTEGVIGYYGAILFVLVYLELARLLGQKSPYFGILCGFTGLLGSAASVFAYGDRIQRGILVAAGVDDILYQTIRSTTIPEFLVVGIIALLFPLTSILLGIGFLRAKALPVWVAVALILAGICFAGGQATETDFGLTVLYPISGLLWTVALAPLGWRMIAGGAPERSDGINLPG
jgi:hypothetical protein